MTNDELRELDRQVTAAMTGSSDRPSPPYSTRPEWSRVLVDEMAADGYVSILAQRDPLPAWSVAFGMSEFFGGETLDIAICRAWLAWKEAAK